MCFSQEVAEWFENVDFQPNARSPKRSDLGDLIVFVTMHLYHTGCFLNIQRFRMIGTSLTPNLKRTALPPCGHNLGLEILWLQVVMFNTVINAMVGFFSGDGFCAEASLST